MTENITSEDTHNEIENPVEPITEPSQPEAERQPGKHPRKTDKLQLLLAVNILFFLALAVLYVLFFSNRQGGNSESMAKTLQKTGKGNMSVAFVNNDSILAHYDLVTKLSDELAGKTKRLEGEIAAKQKAFEKDASYFQDQVQKKALSDQSAQEIYGQLQQNQQGILELRDRYAAELQQNQLDMNVVVLDSVMNFLKRYNEKYKFDYILGFTKGGNILYANDTLDITNDVIKELNEQYHKKNPAK
ncbi:MAG TPA: OmpH family outer membrane protein [Bacteroidales bacterium]|nr:OmpH family outer membrane protein [Bacteroidales bacterium]HPT01946.1 OmpH family outer membrane protein [Bacteroidales bacterium]